MEIQKIEWETEAERRQIVFRPFANFGPLLNTFAAIAASFAEAAGTICKALSTPQLVYALGFEDFGTPGRKRRYRERVLRNHRRLK